MKKDRNSFFSQYGSYGYNQQPMPIPNMNQMQSFNNLDNELDSRISRLEREINRLDSRITKLESTTQITNTTNTDYNFANSMYMV